MQTTFNKIVCDRVGPIETDGNRKRPGTKNDNSDNSKRFRAEAVRPTTRSNRNRVSSSHSLSEFCLVCHFSFSPNRKNTTCCPCGVSAHKDTGALNVGTTKWILSHFIAFSCMKINDSSFSPRIITYYFSDLVLWNILLFLGTVLWNSHIVKIKRFLRMNECCCFRLLKMLINVLSREARKRD